MLLDQLMELSERPSLFEKGTAQFWTDPHIARQMLAAHLDSNTDAASRKPETIASSVQWIHQMLCRNTAKDILDLGCGPGLYTTPLAKLGHRVTGIDFSESSINYAKQQARTLIPENPITYYNDDYLSYDIPGSFDLILMIYCDFSVLDKNDRSVILSKTSKLLKPGGIFLFDVFTPLKYSNHLDSTTWHTSDGGFWRPGPHLCLETSSWFPRDNVHLQSVVVLDETLRPDVYHIWDQTYTPAQLTPLLSENDFGEIEWYGDITGQPYSDKSETIGIVARRK